jgi:hypothetical protein
LPQMKQLPDELRQAVGIGDWSVDAAGNRAGLRIVRTEWCSKLDYHNLCPFVDEDEVWCAGCVAELVDAGCVAKRRATKSVRGLFTWELRSRAAIKVETARTALAEEVAEELDGKPVTVTGGDVARQLMEELSAAA